MRKLSFPNFACFLFNTILLGYAAFIQHLGLPAFPNEQNMSKAASIEILKHFPKAASCFGN